MSKVVSSESLTDDQIKHFREAFSLVDQDDDGKITVKELSLVLKTIGEVLTEPEVIELFAQYDSEGKQLLGFTEFLVMMSDRYKYTYTEAELREAFKIFDNANLGTVNAFELRYYLNQLGEKIPLEEIDEFIKESDPDNDGVVNIEEVIQKIVLGQFK